MTAEWDEIARKVWEHYEVTEKEMMEALARLDDLLEAAAREPEHAAGVRWLRSDLAQSDQDAEGAGANILAQVTDLALQTAGYDNDEARRHLLIASYIMIYRVGRRDATQS